MLLERIGTGVPGFALDEGVPVNGRAADEIPGPDLSRVKDSLNWFLDGGGGGHGRWFGEMFGKLFGLRWNFERMRR